MLLTFYDRELEAVNIDIKIKKTINLLVPCIKKYIISSDGIYKQYTLQVVVLQLSYPTI